ncbi:MAG: ATP-dependent DNA helicase RecG [PS1 clade bacterium]|nr:ATP-dependent DNA helicase RecG [PS1 clade bacterium]MBL6784072.1 ATP-dependent DNA helicase RecG [PS1 clade bacterium]
MRPTRLDRLFADATTLPGIGPKLGKVLAEFTGDKLIDLLFHLPSNLIDRQYRPSLSEVEDGRIATFEVEVMKHEAPPNQGRRRNLPYRILCGNETGYLSLVFFHARGDWLGKAMPEGAKRMVSGRVERFREQLQIVHPDHMLPQAEFDKLPIVEPVYPLTAGLSAKVLMKAIQAALPELPALPEWQEAEWVKQQGWADWQGAVQAAHRPENMAALEPQNAARARLAYDELLAHQLVLALVRRDRKKQQGRAYKTADEMQARLLNLLPFPLTGSQEKAIADIRTDMAEPMRMLRLLQGDVGSGKTVIAVMAMLQAVANGAQAALMAPTEILARQHAETLGPWLDELGINWQVMTARNKGKLRQESLDALAVGDVQIAIGTHALFQDDVAFKDLGLAVVDEQHRFGVQQRMALSSKGNGVDVLVMTATPIPRTLTLTAYGDMDVSRMPDKPPGRKPVDTRVISMDRYEEVAQSLGNAIKDGARIYWVCPLVSESELVDLAAAEDRAKALHAIYGDTVGIVHGQMKPAEKDAVMARFASGEISILVATTVIEVGVNVPEATVMVIEHAERFGLAQLHQLRGRVGRGLDKSSCVLLYRGPLGETAKARLNIMRETEDGFKIAEEDLRLRGAGEVLGTRQSGLPAFRLADLEAHADLLPAVQDDVKLLLERDPLLKSPRGEALRVLLYLFRRDEAIRFLQSG